MRGETLPLQSSHPRSSPRMAADSQLFPHSRQAVKRPPVALCGPVDFEGAVGWMGLKREREEKKEVGSPCRVLCPGAPGAELRI